MSNSCSFRTGIISTASEVTLLSDVLNDTLSFGPSAIKGTGNSQVSNPKTPNREEVHAEDFIAASICDFLILAANHRLRNYHVSTLADQTSTFNIGEGLDWSVDVCKTPDGEEVVVKHIRVQAMEKHSDVPIEAVHIRKARKELLISLHEPLRTNANVLKILGYSFEFSAGRTLIPCLIVEFAVHGTLRQYLTNSSVPKSAEEKRKLCIEVAKGLSAVHSSGIIHGDVKMENILMISSEGGAIAKLADFGSSIITRPDQKTGVYWGTTRYNAPEVRAFEDSQSGAAIEISHLPACDIFSVGLLFFETLMDGEDISKIWDNPTVAISKNKTVFDLRIPFQEKFNAFRLENPTTFHSLKRAIDSALQFNAEERGTICKIIDMLEGNSIYSMVQSIYQAQVLTESNIAHQNTDSDVPYLDLSDSSTLFAILIGRGTEYGSFPAASWDAQEVLASAFQRRTKHKNPFSSSLMHQNLSICYHLGFGVERDSEKVCFHIRAAAKLGSRQALVVSRRVHGALGIHLAEDWLDGEEPEDSTTTHILAQAQRKEPYCTPLAELIQPALVQTVPTTKVKIPFLGVFDPELPLHVSALIGDEKRAQDQIAAGAEDSQNASGATALLVACFAGNLSMAHVLIKKAKSDGSIANDAGHTPLHFLVMFPQKDIAAAAELLKSSSPNVDVSAFSETGERLPDYFEEINGTPLHWAIGCGNVIAVKVLISLGAVIHPNTGASFSPIELATKLLLHHILGLLLKSSPLDKNHLRAHEQPLLFLNESHPFRLMLTHGQNLREAMRQTLKILLQYWDINAKTKLGWTPLGKVALFNISATDHELASQIIAKSDLQLNISQHSLVTSSLIGCKGSTHPSMSTIFRALVVAGAPLTHTSNLSSSWPGWNAFHWAIGSNNLPAVKFITSHSPTLLAIPTSNPEDGAYPLHIAASVDHGLEVLNFLLSLGADPATLTTQLGFTPLGSFISNTNRTTPDFSVLSALLTASAPNNYIAKISSGERESAIHLATRRSGFLFKLGLSGTELLHHILSHPDVRARILNERNTYGMTPLHIAAYYSDYAAVRVLVEAGADLMLKTPRGMTPLSLALEIVRQKHVAEADPTVKKLSGRPHHAYRTGWYIVEKLAQMSHRGVSGEEGKNQLSRLQVAAYVGYYEEVVRLVEGAGEDEDREEINDAFNLLGQSVVHAGQQKLLLDAEFLQRAGLIVEYLHPDRVQE